MSFRIDMTSSSYIAVSEESQIGFARRRVAEICQRISADKTFWGKAAIVVTEMARNLVQHGGGGEIVIREIANAACSSLELLALDKGGEYTISRRASATVSPPPARRVTVSALSSASRSDSRCLANRGKEPSFGVGSAL